MNPSPRPWSHHRETGRILDAEGRVVVAGDPANAQWARDAGQIVWWANSRASLVTALRRIASLFSCYGLADVDLGTLASIPRLARTGLRGGSSASC